MSQTRYPPRHTLSTKALEAEKALTFMFGENGSLCSLIH